MGLDETATCKKTNDPRLREKEFFKSVDRAQKDFLNSKLNVYSMLREIRRKGGCARLARITTTRILCQLGETCEEKEVGG